MANDYASLNPKHMQFGSLASKLFETIATLHCDASSHAHTSLSPSPKKKKEKKNTNKLKRKY